MKQFNYDMRQRKWATIYDYLYTCIRDDIVSGNLRSGTKLPSKRKLARTLSISVTSVENAYAQLVLEGYITSRPGSGFFVESTEREVIQGKTQLADGTWWADDEKEPDLLVDFKANRSSVENFPIATWSKLMRKVLSEIDPKSLGTIPYNGMRRLREAIAKYLYNTRGMQVDPAQIIVGAGTEYLYSRLMQVFGIHTVIGLEDPGYKKFSRISSSQSILWDYIPIDDLGMRADILEERRPDIIHVSPSNHFPTGTIMPVSRRIELLNWAAVKPERYIIEDDYDSELRYYGKNIEPMYALDKNEKVIYMNTFSKSLVPSIRISYMILPPYILERYKETLSFYSCTVSTFEQLTLAMFIEEGYFERHINRMRQVYRTKRDAVIKALKASKLNDICTINDALAGTHFLLRVNTKMSEKEIKERVKEHRIDLALLSDYTQNTSLKNMRTLIVNYAGLDLNNIPLAVSILEDIFLG